MPHELKALINKALNNTACSHCALVLLLHVLDITIQKCLRLAPVGVKIDEMKTI